MHSVRCHKKMRKLKKEQLDELNKWLENFDLQRHTKKISRDFSDGVLLAQLLKQLFPKWVELHNYPPRSSIVLKYNNWETLNRKVLKKLGLHQGNETLNRLSQSVPGIAESLLYQVMLYAKEDQNRRNIPTHPDEKEENGEIMTVNLTRKVGDALVQVPQKMILFSSYERAQEEIAEKNRIISQLNQKVIHLENFLKLKSQRIDDLVRQLANPIYKNIQQEGVLSICQQSSPCIFN